MAEGLPSVGRWLIHAAAGCAMVGIIAFDKVGLDAHTNLILYGKVNSGQHAHSTTPAPTTTAPATTSTGQPLMGNQASTTTTETLHPTYQVTNEVEEFGDRIEGLLHATFACMVIATALIPALRDMTAPSNDNDRETNLSVYGYVQCVLLLFALFMWNIVMIHATNFWDSDLLVKPDDATWRYALVITQWAWIIFMVALAFAPAKVRRNLPEMTAAVVGFLDVTIPWGTQEGMVKLGEERVA